MQRDNVCRTTSRSFSLLFWVTWWRSSSLRRPTLRSCCGDCSDGPKDVAPSLVLTVSLTTPIIGESGAAKDEDSGAFQPSVLTTSGLCEIKSSISISNEHTEELWRHLLSIVRFRCFPLQERGSWTLGWNSDTGRSSCWVFVLRSSVSLPPFQHHSKSAVIVRFLGQLHTLGALVIRGRKWRRTLILLYANLQSHSNGYNGRKHV